MTKADKTITTLEAQGWTYDHSALVSRYCYAGSVSPMTTRGGVEYCRVHEGRCVGIHNWQITYVFRRQKEGAANA